MRAWNDPPKGPATTEDNRKTCRGPFCSNTKDLSLTRVKVDGYTQVKLLCPTCRDKNGV